MKRSSVSGVVAGDGGGSARDGADAVEARIHVDEVGDLRERHVLLVLLVVVHRVRGEQDDALAGVHEDDALSRCVPADPRITGCPGRVATSSIEGPQPASRAACRRWSSVLVASTEWRTRVRCAYGPVQKSYSAAATISADPGNRSRLPMWS